MPFLLAVDFFDYVKKFLHKSQSSPTGKDSQVIWVLQEMDYCSTHGPIYVISMVVAMFTK